LARPEQHGVAQDCAKKKHAPRTRAHLRTRRVFASLIRAAKYVDGGVGFPHWSLKLAGSRLGCCSAAAALRRYKQWAFPSEGDPEKHLSDPRALPGELSDWTDAGGKTVSFTVHGLRATFIGAAHAGGLSDRYAQVLANHALHRGDVHGGYVSEDDLDALRNAAQRVTDYLGKHGVPL
jgi:hypothetical protein